MSERYLWADSLCIAQDSPEKLRNIEQMEAIYQKAKFTIVAAAGSDSLWGVAPGSRDTTQLHAKTPDGILLANLLPSIGQTVNKSHWNTRGRTYQERMLSDRKLYFTPSQISFECTHGVNSEDSHLDCHDITGSDRLNHDMSVLDFVDQYQTTQPDQIQETLVTCPSPRMDYRI